MLIRWKKFKKSLYRWWTYEPAKHFMRGHKDV